MSIATNIAHAPFSAPMSSPFALVRQSKSLSSLAESTASGESASARPKHLESTRDSKTGRHEARTGDQLRQRFSFIDDAAEMKPFRRSAIFRPVASHAYVMTAAG